MGESSEDRFAALGGLCLSCLTFCCSDLAARRGDRTKSTDAIVCLGQGIEVQLWLPELQCGFTAIGWRREIGFQITDVQ
jgi:hypothetical protein